VVPTPASQLAPRVPHTRIPTEWKEETADRPYCDTVCAEEGTQKRRPFLGLHPGFAVPPSVSANRNSSAAIRSRTGVAEAARLRMAGVHSSFPSDGAAGLSSTEPMMSELYSHLFEEVELRFAESEQVGVGFDILAYIAPNCSKGSVLSDFQVNM